MTSVTAADFLYILSDIGVSVQYFAITRVIDPIYGAPTDTYGAGTSKTWVFRKKVSDLELKKWGISDTAEAYLLTPIADTINVGDRIIANGETYEFTPDCKSNEVYVGGIHMSNYYGLKLVA